MHKRPLNPRFTQAVLDGRKITTIRKKPWPVGTPIMLYNWSGAAYQSKQIDVAQVVVESVTQLEITMPDFGEPIYTPRIIDGIPLWSTEGFNDQDDMDSWFYKVVKTGKTVTKSLMRFCLKTAAASPTPPGAAWDGFVKSEIAKMNVTGQLPDYVSTACRHKNGASCNEYGRIHLRVVSMDTSQEGWPLRTVDHGISIEEAHCIAIELLNAIQLASQIATDRANGPIHPDNQSP